MEEARYCMAEAQSVWQIKEARFCLAEAHGGMGVLSLCPSCVLKRMFNYTQNVINVKNDEEMSRHNNSFTTFKKI